MSQVFFNSHYMCKPYDEIIQENTSPTYSQILEACDWRNKRTKIVERDKNACLQCHNEAIKEDSIQGVMRGYYYLLGNTIVLLPEVANHRHQIKTTIFYNGDFKLEEGALICYRNIEAKKYVMLIGYPNSAGSKIDWVFAKGLNVHHTYYQDGLLPWQYPHEALETYCQPCHKRLHDNVKIPRLDHNGNNIGFMTPCPRCAGTGWLEEFNYHQGGVCFCCQGARYTELMEDGWQRNRYCGC